MHQAAGVTLGVAVMLTDGVALGETLTEAVADTGMQEMLGWT